MRLSVTTKIFLGLAVVVLTFGGLSILSVLQLRRIGQDLELISQTYLPLTQLATQLESYQEERTRDTSLLLEQDARTQAPLTRLFRQRYPKLVREKVALGLDLARRGRALAVDAEDRVFLDGVEARLVLLEMRYDGYDRSAEALFDRLDRGGVDQARPVVNDIVAELKQAERGLSRELRTLSRSLAERVTLQVRRAETREDRAAFAIMALSLTAGLVALLVTLFVQRTLGPIQRLTEGVREIRRGNFARRVEVSSEDEIGQLAREFNAMGAALQEREAELDMKRIALLRAERLAAVGRMAAQVSHEIRNPLSSIGLNAELLADELLAARFDEPEHADEARTLLQAISAEVDRLTEITETYLRFARMPRPQLATEDLNALVRSVLSFVGGELSAAGVELHVELAPGLPPVLADESQLRQALLNLLRNAREAMGEAGGRITVATGAEGDAVHVTVSDTGPGVPEDMRERIYDPFFSTKEHGTGLGLALTQQIVSEHGGSLTYGSGPDGGAGFRIDLRPARAAAPESGFTKAAG